MIQSSLDMCEDTVNSYPNASMESVLFTLSATPTDRYLFQCLNELLYPQLIYVENTDNYD